MVYFDHGKKPERYIFGEFVPIDILPRLAVHSLHRQCVHSASTFPIILFIRVLVGRLVGVWGRAHTNCFRLLYFVFTNYFDYWIIF